MLLDREVELERSYSSSELRAIVSLVALPSARSKCDQEHCEGEIAQSSQGASQTAVRDLSKAASENSVLTTRRRSYLRLCTTTGTNSLSREFSGSTLETRSSSRRSRGAIAKSPSRRSSRLKLEDTSSRKQTAMARAKKTEFDDTPTHLYGN